MTKEMRCNEITDHAIKKFRTRTGDFRPTEKVKKLLLKWANKGQLLEQTIESEQMEFEKYGGRRKTHVLSHSWVLIVSADGFLVTLFPAEYVAHRYSNVYGTGDGALITTT